MSTASARKNPDFLFPIRSSGRTEIVICPFDQVIRSDNEAILSYLIFDAYETYKDKLPLLKTLHDKNIPVAEKFQIAISFTDVQLISFLSGGNTITPDEAVGILEEIRKQYNPRRSSRLRLDIALPHLVYEGNIEKLYIVDPHMDAGKVDILASHFKDLANRKVFAVSGTIPNFIFDLSENPTTIFDVDIEEIYYMTKEMPGRMKDVYFLCSSTLLSNYERISTEKLSDFTPEYKYHSWFEQCVKDKFCVVDYFKPMIY